MKTMHTIDAQTHNMALAKALKESGDFEQPTWVLFVKTGAGKMRPTAENDFWHRRAASILRQLYAHDIVGVGRLRTRYGNRKNKGMQPARFYKSGGKIIRLILQQAEAAGLVEKAKGTRAGRKLTLKGKQLVESAK